MTNRALLAVGGVGLKKGRIVNAQKAMISLAMEINPYLREGKFLDGAPFTLINLIFRYGDKYSELAEIEDIDSVHGELPVAVEVPMDELRVASVETVRAAFASVLIPALRLIAQNFNLPSDPIDRFCGEGNLTTNK